MKNMSDLKYLKILITAFFIFSGYIYETTLLKLFGINAGDFFSVSDYLNACFPQTIKIVIPFFRMAFHKNFRTRILA